MFFLFFPSLRILLKIHNNVNFVCFLSLDRHISFNASLREAWAEVFKITEIKYVVC